MEKRKGLTLVDFTTVLVFVILFIFLFEAFILHHHHRVHNVNCGTNLKGIGTAMTVYANDYDDEYPKLGKGTWSKKLGYSYEDSTFPAPSYEGACTITSSLYLLVREADVSPKSFVCPDSPQTEFDGSNLQDKDIVELWDFGPDPYSHVSYAYHNPYGKYPAGGWKSAAFAVTADMSPWFDNGSFVSSGDKGQWPQIITASDESTWQLGMGQFHESEGQNVLFADGHTAYETSANVGVKRDNIYTFWSVEENPSEQDIQGGTAPTSRSAENDAKSAEDSFLAI